ncbi:MAG TPA: tetratricopeptide repeat protein [Gammaproteobacteria bacterium]
MSFIFGIALLAILAAAVAAVPLWRGNRKPQAVLAAVFVAGLAVGIYLLIGRPDLALAPPQPATADNPGDVIAMVEQLAERLERAPDDPEGWTMLGRAYVLMGRYAEAANAFNEAFTRTPGENADLLASYAEARALADPAALQSQAGALFERVLRLDPENARGLWYGGLAAEMRGETELALQRWQELLARDLPANFRQVVESRVAGVDPDAINALVSVTVSVDPSLRDVLPQNGLLFVFLRPADAESSGPPLAARRVEFFKLPVTLPLTRSDILRGGELPDGPFTVSARLSADGDPVAGPGDVEGSVVWNPDESAEVGVVMNQRR